MASFTGVGDNVELLIARKGDNIDVALSGTYAMEIALQRELGSPGSGAFETVKRYTTANATVADTYVATMDNETVRLIVEVDTSGTCTATLTDNENRDLGSVEDGPGGNKVVEYFQDGVRFTGSIARLSGALGSHSATLTVTAAKHAGVIQSMDRAAGITFTLPAAEGTGNIYRFFTAVTVTSNDNIIQVANATDEFLGNLFQIDTDTSDAVAAYPCLDGDGFDTITLNGSTKGGIMGDLITIIDVASGKFALEGTVLCSGTPATPLSAAVS
jgi:hypothetical protein